MAEGGKIQKDKFNRACCVACILPQTHIAGSLKTFAVLIRYLENCFNLLRTKEKPPARFQLGAVGSDHKTDFLEMFFKGQRCKIGRA
jgi:hypothetical protein